MTAALLQQVLAFSRAHDLFRPHDRILVAVSGGPDSTTLLHLLHRLAHHWPITLGVAHFDHRLRGEASQGDAAWVADLAASLGLPFHGGAGDVRRYQRERKISLQVAARTRRLNFFQEIKEQHGYQAIALGHTADDQVELFFLRLLRGAGPQGLRGMTPATPQGLVRPLLGVSKAQILAWLAAAGLDYRQDASNLSRRYRRNRIRLDLLPRLLAYNPRLGEAISRSQTLLGEDDDCLNSQAMDILDNIKVITGDRQLCLPLAPLLALHPALGQRVLRAASAAAGVPLEGLSFRHLAAARRLCQSPRPRGEISLPGNWRLIREGQQIIWQAAPPPPPATAEVTLPETPAGTALALGWTFSWTTGPPAESEPGLPGNPNTALLDFDKLTLPLRVRAVRPGDRFQPLGMAGTKKLQDFFVDAKIPRARRPLIPLLMSRDRIIWVVGQRLAEWVKVTPQTRRLLRLTAVPPAPEPGPTPPP